jgi:hypothetical protein
MARKAGQPCLAHNRQSTYLIDMIDGVIRAGRVFPRHFVC